MIWKALGTLGGTVPVGPAKAWVDGNVGKMAAEAGCAEAPLVAGGRSSGATMARRRCLRIEAFQTEAGRATQEGKQVETERGRHPTAVPPF